jgi:hypothetical protein
MLAAFTLSRADADEDDEFFDPSDFDDEDTARSERTAGTFSAFCLDAAAALIRAATSSAFMPSIALIPPPPPLAPFVVDAAALHNHDAIYLLEGDNVGRGRYPP